MTDVADLIERLLTAAAMIMEDASGDALINDAQSLETRLVDTATAGSDIETLAKAAKVIARRWS